MASGLAAEQCLDLEAPLHRIVAGRTGETALAEHTRRMANIGSFPRCGHADVIRYGRDGAGFRCLLMA